MRTRVLVAIAILALACCAGPVAAQTPNAAPPKIVLTVTVMDLTAGQPVTKGQVVPAGHEVQVTVTTNDIDCAGQWVVTGRSSAPPVVLAQLLGYIVGPAVGTNSATGASFFVGGVGSRNNDYKISASCNGAPVTQFGFGGFEFFVSAQ